jgi:hypothetical protein
MKGRGFGDARRHILDLFFLFSQSFFGNWNARDLLSDNECSCFIAALWSAQLCAQ